MDIPISFSDLPNGMLLFFVLFYLVAQQTEQNIYNTYAMFVDIVTG
jgi:hypothetical protein